MSNPSLFCLEFTLPEACTWLLHRPSERFETRGQNVFDAVVFVVDLSFLKLFLPRDKVHRDKGIFVCFKRSPRLTLLFNVFLSHFKTRNRLSGERGARSAECGVWKTRSVENAECGKRGV